jgi:D-tyrosyl-tRNA(Tyr) deacylase
MKAVLQRCHAARVEVDGEVVGQIEKGLTIFLGVERGDDESCAQKLVGKIIGLRIFDDENGRFNFSVRDVKGAVLVVSNLTLCGDARKGMRPSFSTAAPPAIADALYERFVTLIREQGIEVATGTFSASMRVLVENDGPVTMILETTPAPNVTNAA